MIALALGVLALGSPQAAPPERASGYEFVLPEGWTRQPEDEAKATVLHPPGSKGDARLIRYPLYPVENGTYANEAHFHIAMFQALTENGPVTSGKRTRGEVRAVILEGLIWPPDLRR